MLETKEKRRDVYQMVTDRIIEKLNQGIVPWQRPWTSTGAPQNLITGRHYHGINILLLTSLGYPTNLFLTYKQAKQLGAYVKKGEKSHLIVFWKMLESKERKETDEREVGQKYSYLRYHTVFNIDQCERIPLNKISEIINLRQTYKIDICEKIIAEMPKRPEIRHRLPLAFYNTVYDFINMPKKETFNSDESYYSTLFHELAHSSGHETRLNRKELMEKGSMKSESYSIEELTAEITSCFLNVYAGIAEKQIENNVAYLQSWIGRLKNDKRFIMYASSRAQQATDFILNSKGEEKTEPLQVDEITKLEETEPHPTWTRH